MKKMLMVLLSLTFMVNSPLFLPEFGLNAPPAENLKAGSLSRSIVTPPPDKVCKGDKVPIVIQYNQINWPDPIEFGGVTDAGTLSNGLWSFPSGTVITTIQTTLTANNVGNRYVEFTSSDPADVFTTRVDFEVADCAYKLELNAWDKPKSDLASWNLYVYGYAHISTEPSVEGGGSYSIIVSGEVEDKDLKSGSKGLKCDLEGESSGSGSWDITGSKNKDNINLSVQFQEIDFGEGIAFHCVDPTGVMGEGITPIFESKTINPGDSINVSPSFSKGVSKYKFQFGESGSGQYTLIKRSKK